MESDLEQTDSDQKGAKKTVHGIERRILNILAEALHWSEVGLAGISVLFVALGVFTLFDELLNFREALETTDLTTSIEQVLSDILLLVVGIELALMLVRRTPEALIEVMFFVVARKMLIKADTFVDLIIGVAALAGLFAIRRYLEYIPIEQRRLSRFGLPKKKSADNPESSLGDA